MFFLTSITAGTVLGVASLGLFLQSSSFQEKPVVALPVEEFMEEKKETWKCPDCNFNEKYVLEKLQEKTNITDRNALATIMGNIKSESNFHPDICEGGARVSYDNCHWGGYGIVQWTSIGRYNNLGKFCEKYDCDPSSLEGQTNYMINESVFQRYLPEFEGRGLTVRQYMTPAYKWLGWGIKGKRELYAWEYSKRLTLS